MSFPVKQEPIMSRAFLPLTAALLLGVSPVAARAADDKKTDLETAVSEGKEVALTPAEVVPSDQPGPDGFHSAEVKPGKAGPKVKMPAQAYGLSFYAEPVKGGLKVAGLPESSALRMIRTAPKKDGGGVPGESEVGDVITHANGYAVTSVEDLIVALSTAKDKDDVQLVMKDQNTGNAIVVYVTAVKK
jgi:S1-C subfamily serine protease